MALGKTELLKRPTLASVEVPLAEFGDSIRIRPWYGDEKDALGKAIDGNRDDALIMAAYIAASACDADGNLLFNMNGDIESIRTTWPASALRTAWEAISAANGLGKKGAEAAEKN